MRTVIELPICFLFGVLATPAHAVHYKSEPTPEYNPNEIKILQASDAVQGLSSTSQLCKAQVDSNLTLTLTEVQTSFTWLTSNFEIKPFLIIADHRSGSTMLSSLLDSHPQIETFMEYFQSWPKPGMGWTNHETLAIAFERISRAVKDKGATMVGFKLMTDQIKNVKGGLDPNSDFKIVVHTRRNKLRQIISDYKGMNCGYYFGQTGKIEMPTCEHPVNSETLLRLREFKPTITTEKLIPDINMLFSVQRRLTHQMENFRSRTCMSKYEDWVNPETRRTQMNNIEDCLEIPKFDLVTTMKPVHAVLPVLEIVKNGAAVEQTLRGTYYEFLLEEAPSPSAVFEQLKMSDGMDGTKALEFPDIKPFLGFPGTKPPFKR